jgi:PTS system nitrogen regulatory IIA component
VQLTVRDVAGLFRVSEKTIYRWISEKRMPAHRFHEQYRFNRAELLEWATAQSIAFSPELPDSNGADVSLAAALEAGGISYGVPGTDRETALRAVVASMPLPDEADRAFLVEVLVAREELASTAVGDGLAIPHVRQPIVLSVSAPLATLSFLERPIDFGALDGRPVHTLFTLVSPTVKAHLRLIARVAHALRDDAFKSAVLRRAPREAILAEARRVDARVSGPGTDS